MRVLREFESHSFRQQFLYCVGRYTLNTVFSRSPSLLQLPFALALVFGFSLRRRIAQRLGGSFLRFGVFLFFAAKVHDGSAKRKADGCADDQQNNA